MGKSQWWNSGLFCVCLATACAAVSAETFSTSAERDALIRQAGEAPTDAARLDALRTLRDAVADDATLAAETDCLIAWVGEWMTNPRLEFYWRDFRKNEDYDFGVRENSPLFPLTHLYKARMLVWGILEYGGYANPERYAKARAWLEAGRDAFPGNPILRMYLGEALPRAEQYAPEAPAPAWAVAQRAALEHLTDIIHWWIRNRMREDAQFGGGWGDDCEMWRWQVPVLIGFEDLTMINAQTRFSEAMMNQPHMRDGYTNRIYDVEHTAEDSADVLTPMMHLQPENSVWQARALRLADLFEHLWTGVNERGHLQFKSTYFSVDQVDLREDRACDTVYHPRAVQPTLLLWQRTGDARLGRLFSAWMDTWVDAAARAERGKPAGIVPSAIHWPAGNIGGVGPDWWDPQNHSEPGLYRWPSALSLMSHTLLLTHHMTGDAKYLAPLESMAAARLAYLRNPPEESAEGSLAWCAARLGHLSGVLGKYRFLTGDTRFDDLFALDPTPYVAFRLHGDMKRLEEALARTQDALSVNFEGYTSEVRYTDRVLRFPSLFGKGRLIPEGVDGIFTPDTQLLYACVTGDPGGAGYFPINAVRWLTPPRQIAALVTAASKDRFTAELFHFGAEPRRMAANLYLLRPGDYQVRLTSGAPGKEESTMTMPLRVEGSPARISFTLRPRRLSTLDIRPER